MRASQFFPHGVKNLFRSSSAKYFLTCFCRLSNFRIWRYLVVLKSKLLKVGGWEKCRAIMHKATSPACSSWLYPFFTWDLLSFSNSSVLSNGWVVVTPLLIAVSYDERYGRMIDEKERERARSLIAFSGYMPDGRQGGPRLFIHMCSSLNLDPSI